MAAEERWRDDVNTVLLQFHRMEAGFYQALEGVRAAVAGGRLPLSNLDAVEQRLLAGALSYHRAEQRLSVPHDRAWRQVMNPRKRLEVQRHEPDGPAAARASGATAAR